MGLDITAYRKVLFVREAKSADDDDYDWKRFHRLYPMPHFPAQADGLREGIYEVSGDYEKALEAGYGNGGEDDPDQLKFRAGSYSGYSWWRSELARMVGAVATREKWEVPPAGPFVEQINFSDCEGIIGPRTSAKLAKDYADWQERADAHAKTCGADGDWWLSQYARWRQAFEMAAGEGVVDFH